MSAHQVKAAMKQHPGLGPEKQGLSVEPDPASAPARRPTRKTGNVAAVCTRPTSVVDEVRLVINQAAPTGLHQCSNIRNDICRPDCAECRQSERREQRIPGIAARL